jgi:hypothetical protein
MKRVLLAVVMALSIVTLVGCGGSSTTTAPKSGPSMK